MKQLEKNIVNSFNLAKQDIIELQKKVFVLENNQDQIMQKLDQITRNQQELAQEISRQNNNNKNSSKSSKKPKVFVASKRGSKFHVENCPYAMNIRPKGKITFKSKTKALNEGYKPCNCVQ